MLDTNQKLEMRSIRDANTLNCDRLQLRRIETLSLALRNPWQSLDTSLLPWALIAESLHDT